MASIKKEPPQSSNEKAATPEDDTKSILPSEEEQQKGREMVKLLEIHLRQQNQKQQEILSRTDPTVYDTRTGGDFKSPDLLGTVQETTPRT